MKGTYHYMRILITGVNGQDGSILAKMHLLNGDKVWGTTRTSSNKTPNTIEVVYDNLYDSDSSSKCLDKINPDLIYHLAAKHFDSTKDLILSNEIKNEMYSCHVNVTKNILNWQLKNLNTKSLVALSSQMYLGDKNNKIINENSICNSKNYYAKTKEEAFDLVRLYRNSHGVTSYGAILFNHTSIASKPEFLFPTLARQMAEVIYNRSCEIFLDDPDKEIDICHASDICDGIFKLMNYNPACDLIFSSGKLTKITDLIKRTFQLLKFQGKYDIIKTGTRSPKNTTIVGDISSAKELINWKPTKTPEEILAEQILELVE